VRFHQVPARVTKSSPLEFDTLILVRETQRTDHLDGPHLSARCCQISEHAIAFAELGQMLSEPRPSNEAHSTLSFNFMLRYYEGMGSGCKGR
jgi:hypothetical protein